MKFLNYSIYTHSKFADKALSINFKYLIISHLCIKIARYQSMYQFG
jgi:hypothetical protein